MKLVVCGSMSSEASIAALCEAGRVLEDAGYSVAMPVAQEGTYDYNAMTDEQAANNKAFYIWEHFRKIEQGDALVVINGPKKGLDGYVGSNTLMEMTVAHYLKKPIFMLNKPVVGVPCREEVLGMKPVILDGNLLGIQSVMKFKEAA